MADLKCRAKGSPKGDNVSARVALLFKEVLPWELSYEAAQSTSLSRPIFSAEGFWNASSGQLCMVACAGVDPSRCNLRICLNGGDMNRALLKYPRMNEGVDLCRDLMLSVSALPVQGSGNSPDKPAQAAASTLNVSAELAITRNPRKKSMMLSLEGLYSQATGKMYLVGCRVAPVPRKTVCNITDWQHLDCEIKVEIQYPPTTLRGLTMPTATVSIESNRPKDKDPLYFDPVKLQTSAIMYRSQSEEILSDRQVEVVLRISTLSIVAACILSQLLYVKQTSADAPYVSHVMLGIQALGHHASSYQYDLQRDGSFQIADFIVKSLVLTAFLLTLRLWQKVWESRIRLPTGVPSDKRVLVVCLILHAVGFLVILLTNPNTHLHEPTGTDIYNSSQSPSHGIKHWGARLEQYAGLMQDFFLLPQVVGNIIWQIKCRPLRKGYYLGITLIRLLPHAYDYIRAPLMNAYFDQGRDAAAVGEPNGCRGWALVGFGLRRREATTG
ncbi:unnamed protein product [Spirodela intermedia]|uniref:RING-type E3 ubiquitin transferase n=1 Tax=Spirodela intermedia TaxID=51605 RepID=A0A7I8KZ57_SPIIN|nr:unnamed protein product [Spirodela intermedia]